MEISEQIFLAVDILTDVKLSKLKFDKTVSATVEEIVDLDKGIYRTRYQGNIFTAYARDINTHYKVNDQVYVKIPEGDFSNQKIITGLVTQKSLSEATLNQLSNTVVASSPDIETFYSFKQSPWKVMSGAKTGENYQFDYIYGSENKPYSYDPLLVQYASLYDHFQIKANFRTALNSVHNKGNYGIEVCFFTGDKQGEEISYRLDLGSFNGDPYRLNVYSPQSAIFVIEKGSIKGLKYIRLFQEYFSYDFIPNYSTGESIKVTEPNIFATNLDINFVEVMDLTALAFYCYISTPYGSVLSTDIQNVELHANMMSYGQRIDASKCAFKWFERDFMVFPGGQAYNAAAGYGWRRILGQDSDVLSMTYSDIKDLHQKEYKVVVTYEKVTLTAEKVIFNRDTKYNYAIRLVTNGNVIKLLLENNSKFNPSAVLVGDWYVSYPDGTFAEVLLGKKLNSVEVGNYLLYGAAIFYCAVYDYTKNFIVGTLSFEMVKSESEDDIIVSYTGKDTFNYDASGDLPADNYNEGQELQVNVQWREGKGASNYKVRWFAPDGKEIEVGKITKTVTNSMLHNLLVDSEQKLHYNILNKFNYAYNNNTLSIVIEFDNGKRCTFKKEILFLKDGDQGTNGTSYVAVVRPCDRTTFDKESGYHALRYDTSTNTFVPSDNLFLRCYVYKDGDLLNGNADYELEFDWSKSVGIVPTPQKGSDRCICVGQGTIGPASTSKELERYARVEVTVKDVARSLKLYVFYPIDVIVGSLDTTLVDFNRVPNSIKYSSSGERPNFTNEASIKVIYNNHDYTSQVESLTPALVSKPKLNTETGNYKLEVANYYISERLKDESSTGILKCNIGSDYILHSIVMYLDTYSNAEINSWDGKYLEIGEDDTGRQTYILAPQVGAGEKDPSTNRFTGVIMGKRTVDNYRTGENYRNANKIGLFGFHDGYEVFGFLDDATAFIGKSGAGRIWFDASNNEALIYSGNYCSESEAQRDPSKTPDGMEINLTAGTIDAYNIKISSKNMLLQSDGWNDSGKFLFKMGTASSSFKIQDANGNNLFEISKSTNGAVTYRLRSSRYSTAGETGTLIDLENGQIKSYDFDLRTPALTILSSNSDAAFSFDISKVATDTSGRFLIKYGNKNLFYLSKSSYYLQSYNYDNANEDETKDNGDFTGMKINLQTGKIWANNVELKGRIKASSGTIGNWNISNGRLQTTDGKVYIGTTGFKFGDYFSVSDSGLSIKYDKKTDLNTVVSQIRLNASGISLSVSGTTTTFKDYNGNTYTGSVNCYQKSETYTKTETNSLINVGLNGISIGFSGNTLYYTKQGSTYYVSTEIATKSNITAGINGITLSTFTSTNGSSKTATIELYNGNTLIDSDSITFSGLVTFEGLQNGTTTIDGSCIKTGTIDASRINLSEIRSLGGHHEISIFAYGNDLKLNGYYVYFSTNNFTVDSTGIINLDGRIYVNGTELSTYIKSFIPSS